MLAQLLTPAYLPFATAFIVMVGIGIIEAIGLGLGHLDLEAEVGADADGSFLDWLGLGDNIPVGAVKRNALACARRQVTSC